MERLSLVIPLKNEESSVEALIESIRAQSYQPDEIILVDGGSVDNTVSILNRLTSKDSRFHIVEVEEATPGRGRNIGIEKATGQWIALTDAGIELENEWLGNLVKVAESSPDADLIYGDYSPCVDSFFEECAAIAYVAPKKAKNIRGRFIASSLLKKRVWEKVEGFPDLRAAEDLMFMEAAEDAGFKAAFAPDAMIHWHLRPDLQSTFRKFALYSKHNIWAKRAWDWHYSIAKQYLIVLPFVILALLHSWWWLIIVLGWILARTVKRILPHQYEFGLKPLLNPIYFFSIMFLILVIDAATFTGWVQAVVLKKS